LKRKGWCGHLYSIPTVTSSPHTLEQWQEPVTGTHTLATALWWLAYKYRSKSIYLYSPYFFQIVFMSTKCTNWANCTFSNWYENDIKNLVSYHSHQTLIKISFTSNPYQNILTSLWSGIFLIRLWNLIDLSTFYHIKLVSNF
jgi:hypothetical protein